MSPKKLIDLVVALLLDAFGFLCLLLDLSFFLAPVGEVLSFISDFIGALYFKLLSPSQGKKFWLFWILELIPFSGSFFWWTIYVLSRK